MKDFQRPLSRTALGIDELRRFTISTYGQSESNDDDDQRELEEVEREREEDDQRELEEFEREREEEEVERRLRESESEKEEPGYEEQRAKCGQRIACRLLYGCSCYSKRSLRKERAFEKFVAAYYEEADDKAQRELEEAECEREEAEREREAAERERWDAERERELAQREQGERELCVR